MRATLAFNRLKENFKGNHKLLIAKLNAYGFDSLSLKFISVYLKFRKQKTKVGSTFSDSLNIFFGVPQGSIAGPVFFNVYTCDMFFQIGISEFSSYRNYHDLRE